MRTLYHVTTPDNARGIAATGRVNPFLAQGRRKVSYWVDENRLVWALAHVSALHGVAVNLLKIVAANHDEADLQRTALTGVFCRPTVVEFSDIRPVDRMFVMEGDDPFPF